MAERRGGWQSFLRDAGRVRPAVAAFPLAIFATMLLRQLFVGVGADELSLLRMGEVVRAGSFPYAEYWDVRPPLAYLIGLPSAFADDAGRAVALLRMFAWLAHAAAAYLFFCLFQRGVGVLAAAVGAIALLATANATDLHASTLPNHFVMALAVVAFALLVAGLRGRRWEYLLSALVVGGLPWVMIHAAVVAVGLALLAVLGGLGQRPGSAGVSPACGRNARVSSTNHRRIAVGARLAWLCLAAAPSVLVVGAYWLWGPFDVFVRTVFGAPFAVIEMRGAGYHFFAAETLWRMLLDAPWAVGFVALMALGAAWLPAMWRTAPTGTALHLAPALAAPLALGFALMAYAKPPAPPEYWVEMAPVVGLLAAVSSSKLLGWARISPRVLQLGCAALVALPLALPVDPWREARPPLPATYCKDAAARWFARLRAEDTVLDFTGICGYHLLEAGATTHPPFTFAPMWLRMLDQPWIGHALAADGTPAAADERLRTALGLPTTPPAAAQTNTAAVMLADNRLLAAIRTRGWMEEFHREWRMVWFQRLAVSSESRPFNSLAILVRRSWERHANAPPTVPPPHRPQSA